MDIEYEERFLTVVRGQGIVIGSIASLCVLGVEQRGNPSHDLGVLKIGVDADPSVPIARMEIL